MVGGGVVKVIKLGLNLTCFCRPVGAGFRCSARGLS
jgi:hypothetical protein